MKILSFMKKSQKTSYLENYQDLSSHTQTQDSQPLRVPSQRPTIGLQGRKFKNWETFLLNFLEILEKSRKLPYLVNWKDLFIHIWRPESQNLGKPWQNPTIGLRSSNLMK